VREKLGVQNIVLQIKQYQWEWLQHAEREWTQTGYPNRHWNIGQRGREA
jgi:hypothetical protein